LLLAILLDGETVDEGDGARPFEQMAGEIFEIVTGGFHADQDDLRMGLGCRLFDRLTQLLKSALVDVNLESRRHNLTQAVVDHHDMKVFADIQRDAQELFRGNSSNQRRKSLTAFTTQMDRTFRTHGLDLLVGHVPSSEAQAGTNVDASLMVTNEMEPRRSLGQRYSIAQCGGVDIAHQQKS
jgi:hypothetical protein